MKYKLSYNSPKSKNELLKKALGLSGKKITFLHDMFRNKFDIECKCSKGYFGKLVELYLGASASNLPIPDFPNLNIELKTLPLNKKMQVNHHIKVCATSIFPNSKNTTWEKSILKLKLSRILWIPFESDKSISFKKRRIGHAFISNLNKYEDLFKQDYENITNLMLYGKIEKISASTGKYLILKSTSSNKNLLKYYDIDGKLIFSKLKAFYLKKQFIDNVIHEYLHS